MKFLISSLLLFVVSVCTGQQVVNPKLRPWLNLLASVESKGKTDSFEGMFGEPETYIYLSNIVPPDDKKPRQADYISVIGSGIPKAHSFSPYKVGFVSETWTIVRKHHQPVWRVDSWTFDTTLAGKPTDVTHEINFFSMDHRYFMEDTIHDRTATLRSKKVNRKIHKLVKFWLHHEER